MSTQWVFWLSQAHGRGERMWRRASSDSRVYLVSDTWSTHAPESMTDQNAHAWHESNQAYLAAALDYLRALLEAHIARSTGGPLSVEPSLAAASAVSATMARPSSAERACRLFGLSEFERDLLLLCAAVEFDAAFASLCASASGDPARPYATFGLALAALPNPHWSALSPDAPLRRFLLVEPAIGIPGTPLTRLPLRIDERVLHYLAGVAHGDERLVPLLAPQAIPGGDVLVPAHAAIADQVIGVFGDHDRSGGSVVQVCGSDAVAKRAIVAAAAHRVGRALRVIDATALPSSPGDLALLVRLMEREAALGGWVYLIDCDDQDAADSARLASVQRLVDALHVPVALACRDRWTSVRKSSVVCEVDKPAVAEQRRIWQAALGESAARLNGHVDRLVTHFHLGAQAIRDATAEAAAAGAVHREPEDLATLLWDACRARARPRLDDLAQRIEPSASWHDLVLPEPQRQILREIAVHVRRRATVYEQWGFAAQSARGLGISALFSGPSGTGKTMAAEVLARELRLDLYRVDLSATVSKYIGETEKNLRRIFDAAEEGGVILLFDEADALFGKRSEVKDSHDRYANIEVGYLLQRMEAYRGLAILTTNLKGSLDSAFLRRIRFVVQFPFPDVIQRTEIWRRVFPARTPTSGLDERQLARLNVGGGNIRNIALGAAFLAAEADEPVRMPHLLRAAQVEYAKLEKPLTEAEAGEWPDR